MKVTGEGIWRWKRTSDGREFDLPVVNVAASLGGSEPATEDIGNVWLRVFYLGGYYDVDGEMDGGEFIAKVSDNPHGDITEQHPYWVHPLDFLRE